MIEFLPQSEGKTVGIKISGTLTHEDYQHTIPKLENLIKEHQKLNMLVEVGNPPFDHMELRAMYDDARFGIPHRNDFEKFAIVGELPVWADLGATIGSWFTTAQIKEFTPDEKDKAWDWITH